MGPLNRMRSDKYCNEDCFYFRNCMNISMGCFVISVIRIFNDISKDANIKILKGLLAFPV